MRIKDTDIPQAAVDSGKAAMQNGFVASEIQAAVSASLRGSGFAYPSDRARDMDELDMRVADGLIQKARKAGEIRFAKGRWTVN